MPPSSSIINLYAATKAHDLIVLIVNLHEGVKMSVQCLNAVSIN